MNEQRRSSPGGRQGGMTLVSYALSGAAVGAAAVVLLQVYRPEVASLMATATEFLRNFVTG